LRHDEQASGWKISNRETQYGALRAVNKGKESLVISKKVVAICAALGVAFTGTSLAVPAVADPVANTYAIVGSDTLEDAVNALVNGAQGSSLRTFTSASTMGSFDATGSACIVTKPFKKRMPRPNGSGDGVNALKASMKGGAYSTSGSGSACDTNGRDLSGDVDMARSSSTPAVDANRVSSSYTPAGTEKTLAYYPFGRDAMAYAYHSGSNIALATLNTATLKQIFECTTRTIGGVTVTPIIPQTGSGTRSAWLTAIGSNETLLLTTGETGSVGQANAGVAGCVEVGQEHDGRSLTSVTLANGTVVATGANSVMPMSVSRWVAMQNGVTVDKIGSAVLAPVSDVGVAAVSGTAPSVVPNPTYYANSTWGRETWLVVDYERIRPASPSYDPVLAAALDSSVDDSLTNVDDSGSYASGFWKKKFGILPPASSTITAGVLRIKYTF